MLQMLNSWALPPADLVKEVALHHLAPGLGVTIATLMYLSPLQAIQRVAANKSLGMFNPIPLVATSANCAANAIYGAIVGDPYVGWGNEPGLLLGLYMTFVAFAYADGKTRTYMMAAILGFTAAITSTSMAIALYLEDQAARQAAAGCQAVAVLLLFYAAPLSALLHVLRTRCSAPIHAPLCAMALVNSSLWVLYGWLAIDDIFIYGPNAVGFLLACVQLLLRLVFPSTPAAAAKQPGLAEVDDDIDGGSDSSDDLRVSLISAAVDIV